MLLVEVTQTMSLEFITQIDYDRYIKMAKWTKDAADSDLSYTSTSIPSRSFQINLNNVSSMFNITKSSMRNLHGKRVIVADIGLTVDGIRLAKCMIPGKSGSITIPVKALSAV